MDNEGLYMFQGFYAPCDDCDDSDGKCQSCDGDGWILTDDDEWHPYGAKFAEYDKRKREGYFAIVLCEHCGYKMPICYEYNIVDERYHADVILCGNCDKELE